MKEEFQKVGTDRSRGVDLEALHVITWSDSRQQQQFGCSDGARCQDHLRRRFRQSLLTFVLECHAHCSLTVKQNLTHRDILTHIKIRMSHARTSYMGRGNARHERSMSLPTKRRPRAPEN